MTVIWKPELDAAATRWQALADQLGRDRFGPLAEELDREQRYPWETIEALVANNFTGLFLPRDFGGQGESLVTTVAAVETLGTHCASTAAIMCAYQLGAFPILLAGTDKQKDFYLREMTQGRATSFALSERIAGSDAAASRPPPRAKAMAGACAARNTGSATEAPRATTWCLPRPTRPRAAVASAPSWSTRSSPAR